jgi:abequosyltransferase
MSIKISFCIPTLNFGPFIGITLQSIIEQADESIQIVIVDGGSTDNTAQIVADAIALFPNIKYIQRESRCGVDIDILESVSQADGEFCWLFSSDDVLSPRAIARAIRVIAQGGWDVFVMGVTICDFEMHELYDHPIFKCPDPFTLDWSHADQRREYFSRAHTSTAFFSFISAILVRRERWVTAPIATQSIGSCWIIAAKIYAMSSQGLRVRYDPKAYVLKRGENDSFASNGVIPRIRLSIEGFRRLGEAYFGQSSFESKQIHRVLLNEYPLSSMLWTKSQLLPTCSNGEAREFYRLLLLHFSDRGWEGAAQYLIVRWTPAWIVKHIRTAYLLFMVTLRPLLH